MARGFESKSVEEQQSEARREPAQNQILTPEEMEGRRKLDGLLLSRTSVQSQLNSATNPAHRQMLEKALAELDRQIAELGS
ncbi:MAG TPA: hypothetical protein VNX88_22395 [Terriglobales bacterium]|jgi:hypothetical protein|nr:hypothetical protein [Terriglobales bacterium]